MNQEMKELMSIFIGVLVVSAMGILIVEKSGSLWLSLVLVIVMWTIFFVGIEVRRGIK